MADTPDDLEDDALDPQPPSRRRRVGTIAIVVALIASMVVLAFVSGRGVVRVVPDVQPSTPATTTTTPPRTSRLALVETGGRLVTTDAFGTSVVAYEAPGVVFSFPAWSPDGSRIAALGQTGGENGVYVFSVAPDGSATAPPAVVYRSTDRPPFYLYWAPDSRRLTFLTTEPDGLALRLAPVEEAANTSVVRAGSPLYWAWADPNHLLVHSGGAGPDGFFAEIGVDGASLEPAPIAPGDFRAPAVTSDGRYRAYVVPGEKTAAARVVVELRDRSAAHPVDVFGPGALDFGPGSNELAFIAAAEAGRAVPLPVGPLRLVDAMSGRVRTLLRGSVAAFFWAPDGRTIAALEVPGTGDDRVAGAGDRNRVSEAVARPGDPISLAVANGPRPATVGPLAAPGLALRLVFVTVESGAIRSQRPLQMSDTFIQQVVPFFDQYALSHNVWSADGSAVVLPVVEADGTERLAVVRADGSDARTVADGIIAFWGP